MFGWSIPPHCTLCRFDGEVCKKKCNLDKGCYVDECGKISTRGCCEVELQLFENRVRKKCNGSPPGCGDEGRRGGPNIQKEICCTYVAHMLEEKNKMHYLGCNSDYDCRMKDPTRPKCNIALGRCQECVMNHNHCTPPKRCVPGVTKHLAFSRNHLFLGF